MEIIGYFLLLVLIHLGFVFLSDLLLGMRLSASLRNMTGPFQIMTVPEYVIVFFLLCFMVVPSLISFLKKRR